MNKMKRITCTFLILVMVLTSCPVFYASSGAVLNDDSMPVLVAKGLGIIDEYNGEKEITAGEFSAAIDILSGIEGTAKLYFDEADADADVTHMKAVSVFVDMAGYTEFTRIQYGNSSENSTLLTAGEIGLLDGITASKDSKLTMSNLVGMAYNLMSVKMLSASYYNNFDKQLHYSDTSYMNKVLKMFATDGIVETVSYTSVMQDSGTNGDKIIIDGNVYFAQEAKYEDLVGCRVKAFYKDIDGERTVVALINKSEIFEVDARDICKDYTTKKVIYYYGQNDRRIKLELDSSVDVIYNYSLMNSYSASDFKINQGRLLLIDNDSNGKYDVVKIEEYDAMLLFSVSTVSELIIDSFGNSLSISELIKNNYPVYSDGKLISVENIPAKSVATYYLNKKGQIVRMYISTETMGGRINSFDEQNNEIEIDSEVFRYTDSIKDKIEAMPLGSMITVWLDAYGGIAYAEVTAEKYTYGYLVTFYEGNGLKNPTLKIFTEDNKFELLETRTKINFNGKNMSARDVFEYNLTTGFWDEVGKINQLIKYKVNSDNLITTILTATSDKDGDGDRPILCVDQVSTYCVTAKTVNSRIRLGVHSKVFAIPEDLSYENSYSCGLGEVLANDEYSFQVFNVDEDRYAGVVVARIPNYVVKSVDTVTATSYLVDKTGTVISDSGAESTFITIINPTSGAGTTVKFAGNDIFSSMQNDYVCPTDLKRGDIIQYSTYNNEGSAFKIWYVNGSTQPFEKANFLWYGYVKENLFYSDGQTFAAGVVKEIIKDGFIVNNWPDTEEYGESWDRTITTTAATPVMICDNAAQRIYQGSIGDLAVGDKIFAAYKYALPKYIVIYRD